MPSKVNLDALILREDFQVVGANVSAQGSKDEKMKLAQLESGTTFFK